MRILLILFSIIIIGCNTDNTVETDATKTSDKNDIDRPVIADIEVNPVKVINLGYLFDMEFPDRPEQIELDSTAWHYFYIKFIKHRWKENLIDFTMPGPFQEHDKLAILPLKCDPVYTEVEKFDSLGTRWKMDYFDVTLKAWIGNSAFFDGYNNRNWLIIPHPQYIQSRILESSRYDYDSSHDEWGFEWYAIIDVDGDDKGDLKIEYKEVWVDDDFLYTLHITSWSIKKENEWVEIHKDEYEDVEGC